VYVPAINKYQGTQNGKEFIWKNAHSIRADLSTFNSIK